MKKLVLLLLFTLSLLGSNIKHVTLQGKYIYNKEVVAYINSLPREKLQTVTHMAYTLWQEARNRSSGDIEYHYELIASVIVNRTKANKKEWGKSMYRVIHKPYQFSCWRGMRQCKPISSDYKAFLLALKVSYRFVFGLQKPITTATYYHEKHLKPKWRNRFTRLFGFGSHIFYRG